MAALILSIIVEGLGVSFRIVEGDEPCDLVYAVHEPSNDRALWLPALPSWTSGQPSIEKLIQRDLGDAKESLVSSEPSISKSDELRSRDQSGGGWHLMPETPKELSTNISQQGTEFGHDLLILTDILCPRNRTGGPSGDLLYSSWLVLTGALEGAEPKNRFGVPIVGKSSALYQAVVRRPLVGTYVLFLSQALRTLFGDRFTPIPRWPNGADYAIVLSHDVDRPLSRPTADHYKLRVVRDLRAQQFVAASRSIAGYFKNVLLRGDSGLQSASDPNFGFDKWMAFEQTLKTKSAFYVAVRHSAEEGAAWEEVNYDFKHPAIIDRLRFLTDSGWEVGLHASIACQSEPHRFAIERQLLSDAVGKEVRGLRHHYWALDPVKPQRTLKQHADAGFDYDSSLGFNDAPGFRSGLAWPFNPIDGEALRFLDIFQLPPTLMDGGIFYTSPTTSEGEAAIHNHIRSVAAIGGAVVFNWHVAQQNPIRLSGAGPALVRVLSQLSGDSAVYWATPEEVVDWWSERRRLIAQAKD